MNQHDKDIERLEAIAHRARQDASHSLEMARGWKIRYILRAEPIRLAKEQVTAYTRSSRDSWHAYLALQRTIKVMRQHHHRTIHF